MPESIERSGGNRLPRPGAGRRRSTPDPHQSRHPERRRTDGCGAMLPRSRRLRQALPARAAGRAPPRPHRRRESARRNAPRPTGRASRPRTHRAPSAAYSVRCSGTCRPSWRTECTPLMVTRPAPGNAGTSNSGGGFAWGAITERRASYSSTRWPLSVLSPRRITRAAGRARMDAPRRRRHNLGRL